VIPPASLCPFWVISGKFSGFVATFRAYFVEKLVAEAVIVIAISSI
jgi:hypothetical protein